MDYRWCNATLFLHSMTNSWHGKLRFSSNNEWYFTLGRSTDSITLSDLMANCQNLIDRGQLFKGHAKFRNVYNAHTQLGLKDCILRHVSAHGLQSLLAPTSLKAHANLSSTDKEVLDAAYEEEYDGLASLPTWDVVTEEQFKLLSKGR